MGWRLDDHIRVSIHPFFLKALYSMALLRLSSVLFLLLTSGNWAPTAGQVSCTTQKDCYPQASSSFRVGSVIPSFFVECVVEVGRCACHGTCFVLDAERNVCEFADNKCVVYDEYTFGCKDTRKSQFTALLLAIFFGVFGGANFYLGRLGYAISQLSLFVLGTFGGGLFHALWGRKTEEGEPFIHNSDGEVPKRYVILNVVVAIIPVVAGLWWLADILIFCLDLRRDSHGCKLSRYV